MRIVTYINSLQQERLGLQEGIFGQGIIIDLEKSTQALSSLLPSSFVAPRTCLELIENFNPTSKSAYQTILDTYKKNQLPAYCFTKEESVTLKSPIPRPPSMRDGYAFRQHVEAARRNRGVPMIEEFDHFPVFYFTNHQAVTGPGDVLVQKQALDKCDFELETAIVIGKKSKNLKTSHADEAIFGYLIMNDWSARTLQMEEMKLSLGPAKGKDFATSLGPYLVTKDELEPYLIKGNQGDRYALSMKCFVNGTQVSQGNMKDMTWTFAQILERVSYGVTVYPGDVIGSGTVGTGCFLELNGSKITQNQWLKPGDEVILEVEGLGILKNRIVEASDDSKV